MMMILGMFVFSIPTATYQKLQRETSWNHVGNNRFGDMPAYQYTGKGEDLITLDGSIVPEFGSPLSLVALRLMADTGKSFPLIAGNGKIYGMCAIRKIADEHEHFFPDGTAAKVTFTINLVKTMSAGNLISTTLMSL